MKLLNPEQPLLLGHRGAPDLAPENTLASYRAALDAGLDGLEIDLQLTSDGVLVLHHDDDIKGQRISSLNWNDVQAAAPEVSRFEALLDALADYPDSLLNIELKSPGLKRDQREAVLTRVLAGHAGGWPVANGWISTFDPISLVTLSELGVALPLAFLVNFKPLLRLLPCLPVHGVHAQHKLVTAEQVRAWHEQDLFVFAWTVNEEPLGRELLSAGVDGLIGDHPALLRAAADR